MKPFLKTYAPTILSGALLALAFPKWNLFPLAWIALIPLTWRAHSMTPRVGALHFFLAGWAFNSVLLHWLMTNVYWAGGWAFWGYQFLCVVLAIFWAATGAAWIWMRRRAAWGGGACGLAMLWMAMEFVHARLFSGFGWGALGYSQGPDLAIEQWAALGGVSVVSGIIVAFNALVALAILEGGNIRIVRAVAAVLLLGLAHGVGALLLGKPDYDTKPYVAGIVQADFSLEMKSDGEYRVEMVRNACEKSRKLAEHAKVDLFVWPESMVMDDVANPEIHGLISAMLDETGAWLYTGSERRNEQGGYPNTSAFINPNGEVVDIYDKVHLVAFGEYVPFGQYLPFIQQVVPAIGDIAFGDRQKVFQAGGRIFGPLICFEVLFADLSETLRQMGADFLVVITNLGWFGESAAIPQELELARLRAIETRLPVVHCANTGISGVFDPWGRFTLVNGVFTASGNFVDFTGRVSPAQTIMQRVVGALPVPAPGKPPIPRAPALVPWIVFALALGWVVATFLARRGSSGNAPSSQGKRRGP